MTYHSCHSPLCSPSSSCFCRHNQSIGHLNLSPTHPSAYKRGLIAPEQVPDARSIHQYNYAPPPPSTIQSVTLRSTTWNNGKTGTRPDSMQVAPEYAQVNIIQPSSFARSSEYPSDATHGQRGNIGRGRMHSHSSLVRESPTPRHAAARDDHFSSLHPNAIVNAGNWRNSSSSSSVTTVSPSATSFVSSTSPQPPGSAADASHGQVLRSLGRWLSTHEYLNTGQDPIIGHDCPPEADVLGIRGMTVLTAFFDHTDRETFRCHVCPDVSYDLEDAILHQRRAMHHQD